MPTKINLDGKEFNIDRLSDHSKGVVALLQFSDQRIVELTNMKALLQRAKNSYAESLRKEIISDKAGLMLGDD